MVPETAVQLRLPLLGMRSGAVPQRLGALVEQGDHGLSRGFWVILRYGDGGDHPGVLAAGGTDAGYLSFHRAAAVDKESPCGAG